MFTCGKFNNAHEHLLSGVPACARGLNLLIQNASFVKPKWLPLLARLQSKAEVKTVFETVHALKSAVVLKIVLCFQGRCSFKNSSVTSTLQNSHLRLRGLIRGHTWGRPKEDVHEHCELPSLQRPQFRDSKHVGTPQGRCSRKLLGFLRSSALISETVHMKRSKELCMST